MTSICWKERNFLLRFVLLVSIYSPEHLSYAKPVSVCPSRVGIYYIVDNSNECVYHLCFAGTPTAVACPQGSSTQKSYEGTTYPCVLKNTDCSGLLPTEYFTSTTTTTEIPEPRRSTPLSPSTTPDLLDINAAEPLSLNRLSNYLFQLSTRGSEGLSQLRMYASMLGLLNGTLGAVALKPVSINHNEDIKQQYQLKMYAAILGLNTTNLYRLKMLARNAGINETTILSRLKGYALFMLNSTNDELSTSTSLSKPDVFQDNAAATTEESINAMYARLRASLKLSSPSTTETDNNSDNVSILLRNLFNVTAGSSDVRTNEEKISSAARKTIGPEDIPAALLETIPDHRVSGGRLTCKRCELRECLTACYSTYGCAAVDYDWQFHQCYVHTLSDVCGPLIAFINVTHYRRLLCSSGIPTVPARFNSQTEPKTGFIIGGISFTTSIPLSLLPSTDDKRRIVAHTSELVANPDQRFSTPTLLPVDWIAYPGFHIANADNMVTVDDGNSCVEECRNRGPEWCAAFDFDAALGQCFFHRPATACNQLRHNRVVYHVKIASCEPEGDDIRI